MLLNLKTSDMKLFKISLFSVTLLSISSLAFTSCNSTGNKGSQTETQVENSKLDEDLVNDFNKSKHIFYSLPSPLETAVLIKKAGSSYNEELLNPISNVSNYNSNYKMAINLGVYSADLSYTSLFDQNQTSIKYMGNARKLADGLGIMGAIDESSIERLQENMNNREIVMEIVSETFMNSNAYLAENNRPTIGVMVLVGGWVEGLYLATKLTNGTMENEQLVERILYQKLSLETVISLIDEYNDSNEMGLLREKMEGLKNIYNNVEIKTGQVDASTNAETQVTTIKTNSSATMSPEIFKQLLLKVEEIRNDFIS